MNPYKKLLKNSVVFTIASFGSKLLSFFLVPYYTHVLSTDQLGTADAIINTVALLLPVISLSIQEAVLRYVLDSSSDNDEVLSIGLVLFIVNSTIMTALFPILIYLGVAKEFLLYTFLILFAQGLYNIFGQYIRAMGFIKEFAVGGVINTIVLLITNIITLSFMKMGIIGYLQAYLLSYICCCIYYIYIGKIYRHIIRKINIPLAKDMIKYCTPLIPNALMWWIMNLSDRYMIIYFINISASGIYAVSHKIPTIINLISSIFSQAWQLSAIEEKDLETKNEFFTNVFNLYAFILFGCTIGIIAVSKPIVNLIIQESYLSAVDCIPFLMLAMVFSSYGMFLGTIYAAEKSTFSAMISTILGAIVNIIFNFLLIPRFGSIGAAIGTMVGLFVLWIYRAYDTRKYIKITYDIWLLFSFFFFISIELILYYNNVFFGIQIVLTLCFLLINYKQWIKIIKVIMLRGRK